MTCVHGLGPGCSACEVEGMTIDRARLIRLKRYSITVEGYAPEQFDAVSPSAARWQAYRAFTEATRRLPFREFLSRTSTLHLGAAHAD